MCMCVSVFTLHANLDVPIVAQTSWCCRRSSQKLFSSVVKFNFDVFLCHRMCSLPSCWGRPSRAALAGPRGRQSCIPAVYPLTDFMKRAQASFPPSPSLSFPRLGQCIFQTEMLSLDLSLSLKAHVAKFLKNPKYPTKERGKPL